MPLPTIRGQNRGTAPPASSVSKQPSSKILELLPQMCRRHRLVQSKRNTSEAHWGEQRNSCDSASVARLLRWFQALRRISLRHPTRIPFELGEKRRRIIDNSATTDPKHCKSPSTIEEGYLGICLHFQRRKPDHRRLPNRLQRSRSIWCDLQLILLLLRIFVVLSAPANWILYVYWSKQDLWTIYLFQFKAQSAFGNCDEATKAIAPPSGKLESCSDLPLQLAATALISETTGQYHPGLQWWLWWISWETDHNREVSETTTRLG